MTGPGSNTAATQIGSAQIYFTAALKHSARIPPHTKEIIIIDLTLLQVQVGDP